MGRDVRSLMLVSLCALVLARPAECRPPASPSRPPSRSPAIREPDSKIAINNLDMSVSNIGEIAYRSWFNAPGLFYPRDSSFSSVVFAGGLWLCGKRAGASHVSVAEYTTDFFPGPLSAPDQNRFRTYTLLRGDTTGVDYLAWPVQDGAPVDASGKPALVGDEMLWSVFNDAGNVGFEVRQSTFAFASPGTDSNTIYVRYELTNKSGAALDSAYVGLWLDPDLGNAVDDRVGCDTTLALGYCYNASPVDAVYGSRPPAVGVAMIQSPRGMSSFSAFARPLDPVTSEQRLVSLHGLNLDGTPMRVFDSGAATKYRFSGDPVSGGGWVDTSTDDRRFLVATGPVSIAAGATDTIIVAVVVGQGSDYLSSVTDLRSRTSAARALYQAGFPASGSPPPFLRAPQYANAFVGDDVDFDVRLYAGSGAGYAYALEASPPGASITQIDPVHAHVHWNTAGATPDYVGITSLAISPAGDTLRAVTVAIVARRDAAPVFGPVSNMLVYAGTSAEQTVTATDPDGDYVSMSDCSPRRAFYVSVQTTSGPGTGTARVVVTPDFTLEGERDSIVICATDFTLTSTIGFRIDVRRQPYPPYLSADPQVLATVGAAINVNAEIFDPNLEDTLRIHVEGAPPGFTLTTVRNYDQLNATLFGVPRAEDVGTHLLRWTGSDGVYPDVVDTTLLVVAPRPAHLASSLFSCSFLTYALYGRPKTVAFGDLDGDGRTDAVVGMRLPPMVGVLPSDPTQGFGLETDYLLPAPPFGIALGDWNGDGHTDLAAVCESLPDVHVFLGSGGGIQQAADQPATFAAPSGIVAGDLNGDGKVDLAVTDSESGRVHFLRGSGDGGFHDENTVEVPVGSGQPMLADFNRDGISDLVCASALANRVSVVLGPLFLATGVHANLITINNPIRVIARDFTGDGFVDLVVVGAGSFFGGDVTVWAGRGNGNFIAGPLTSLASTPTAAQTADVDEDGRVDLILSQGQDFLSPSDQEPLLYLPGRGDGTFAPAVTIPSAVRVPVTFEPKTYRNLALLDVDTGGGTAIAAIDPNGTSLDIYPLPAHGVSGGGILRTRRLNGMAFRDLDGDGAVDLAACRDSDLVVWSGRGDGTFPVERVSPAGRAFFGLAAGDFDGDGWTDLLLRDFEGVYTAHGQPPGSFGPPVRFTLEPLPDSTLHFSSMTILDVRATDLDSDGYTDAVVAYTGYSQIQGEIYGLLVARGSSTGLGPISIAPIAPSGYGTFGFVFAPPGFVLLSPDPSSTGVRIGIFDGNGNPVSTQDLPGLEPSNAVSGDFDGDGHEDIAMAGFYRLEILKRQTDGTFIPEFLTRALEAPAFALAASDFDEDGIADLAAADQDPSVRIFPGHVGGFSDIEGWVGHGIGSGARQLAVADLNGDGAPDLAARCDQDVSFLLNQSPSAPAAVLEQGGYVPGAVEIVWRTTMSAGTKAHVYRSSTTGGSSRMDSLAIGADGRVSFQDPSAEPGESYTYRLGFRRSGVDVLSAAVEVSIPTPPAAPVPSLTLGPVAPNPARGQASIAWSLPASGVSHLRIFDVRGRLVKTLHDGASGPGSALLVWDGRDSEGRKAGAGVYWVRLESAVGNRTTKLVLLR